MPKYLQLLTPHHRWRVPLQDVSEHYADQLEERGTNDWNEEVTVTMEDPEIAIDHLLYGTTPSDFKSLKITHRERVQIKDSNDSWPEEGDDFDGDLYEWTIVEED